MQQMMRERAEPQEYVTRCCGYFIVCSAQHTFNVSQMAAKGILCKMTLT
jgi:hypothetical protein